MHQHIVHLLQTYGYWSLFIALAAEYFFVPVPGETTLVTLGILWQSHNYGLTLFWALVSTTLGTFTGSMIAYAIGRSLGRPFLERFGRYVRLTPARIDNAERLFNRYTLPTLIISRYIAFVRIIVPYLAGINRVPLWVYIPAMLISSLAWTTTFIVAGNLVDKIWTQFIHHWRQEAIPAILIVIAASVGYWYLHRWIMRKVGMGHDKPKTDK